MKHISTKQVAEKVGIGRATLERWLAEGKITPPRASRIGDFTFRAWTSSDVGRVRKYKQKNYRRGRGRKKGRRIKK